MVCEGTACEDSQTVLPLDLQSTASVFVFDFDDTLLPTTALGCIGELDFEEDSGLLASPAMRQVDALASKLLESAANVPRSIVVLLTNAAEEWVWRSTARHLPTVYGLLSKQVALLVSAHRALDDEWSLEQEFFLDGQHAESWRTWKDEVVRSRLAPLLQTKIAAMGPFKALQVLSMGDSLHDLEAGRTLLELVAGSEPRYLKTIQMQHSPSIKDLVAQLRLVVDCFPRLCRKPKTLQCSMQPKATKDDARSPSQEEERCG